MLGIIALIVCPLALALAVWWQAKRLPDWEVPSLFKPGDWDVARIYGDTLLLLSAPVAFLALAGYNFAIAVFPLTGAVGIYAVCKMQGTWNPLDLLKPVALETSHDQTQHTAETGSIPTVPSPVTHLHKFRAPAPAGTDSHGFGTPTIYAPGEA